MSGCICMEAAGVPTSPRSRSGPRRLSPRFLHPDALHRHTDQLYRAAWGLCGSAHDAEDLVQETFANVLKRPRLLRDDNEVGYLLRTGRQVSGDVGSREVLLGDEFVHAHKRTPASPRAK